MVSMSEFDPQAFPLVVVPIKVRMQEFEALVDNGVNINVISEKTLALIKLMQDKSTPLIEQEEHVETPVALCLAHGGSAGSQALGQVRVHVQIGDWEASIRATIVSELACDVVVK